MITHALNETDYAALAVLRSTGADVLEAALEARKDRRVRTVYDFRYITRRFMKRCKGLATRRVRSITPQECAQYIEQAFETPRQRQKARLILSGVFGTAVKRGIWKYEVLGGKYEVKEVRAQRSCAGV